MCFVRSAPIAVAENLLIGMAPIAIDRQELLFIADAERLATSCLGGLMVCHAHDFYM
jgi:hypothetical protein